jgi:hypothetical protein
MSKIHKEKDSKRSPDEVTTPPPPQIIDPSSLPEKGKNARYKKEERIEKNKKE